MEFKKLIAVSSIVTAASSTQAQENNFHKYVFSPQYAIEGMSYDRALEILKKSYEKYNNEERLIEYGEPVIIKVDKEQNTLDLSDFDGWTVRVPLDSAAMQPNKVDATK
ncbi:MAG: hypothetical protein ACXVCY_07615 [Pseudobdellovibrionaceae bacterium]